jgi:hypothetical protein
MSLLHPNDRTLREAQSAFLEASAAASHALYKLDHLMPRKQLEVWLQEALPVVQEMAQARRQPPSPTVPEAKPLEGGSHDGALAPIIPLTSSKIGPGI